ncbi:hypothetical protein A3O17_01170 [Ligilactobacillus aviarius]|uniref:hypothetical protein n=1 Tax=Ligilactobacillus aviarius TaxID=1606 RepID=UPI0007D9B070|nr:hypothetical protein [Ligilactobacillus aviarius]OAQ06341.1 hypothetical protein A3O15_03050 [Ligilactobacillus aviarius]OAS74838.1 hypothetical protein A3O17_01170 [Ligilactobacillus aviarius]
MRAAVIGYNIFAVGGTTQSNLNLLSILNQHMDSTVYFNYLPFSQKDIQQLQRKIPGITKTEFARIKDLFDRESSIVQPYDIVFITRENLFPLSKILRAFNPQALIIGEIHTPLALLDNSLPGLSDLSCVRVATDSIREKFAEKYNFDRIYVQTVSLAHLKWGEIDTSMSKNFVVKSRFFEKQKDIMYSLRLFNDLKQHGKTDFHLYIQGTGADEFDYRSYIDGNHLRSMVSINHSLPQHYTYLSTSKCETLGYSIAEAVANGHQVLAYLGDDDVIYENFKDVPMVHWLEKHSLVDDAEKLIEASQHAVSDSEFIASQEVLKMMSADYYSKLERRTAKFKNLEFETEPLTDQDYIDVQIKVENKLGSLNPGIIKRIYYRILKMPLFKQLFGLRFFQRLKQKIK